MLIINGVSKEDKEIQNAIKKLTSIPGQHTVIHALDLNISHCIGCYNCMLQTPGICCLQDDYEKIFKQFFVHDDIVFLSEVSLKFLNYKIVNVIQRMFPLVTFLSTFQKGRIYHIPRYDKSFRIGLLYKGSLNQELLSAWFEQYTKHFCSVSMGVHPIENVLEVQKCML